MHSDIDTLERVAILQALQKGEFAVLVGINLLREDWISRGLLGSYSGCGQGRVFAF